VKILKVSRRQKDINSKTKTTAQFLWDKRKE
jgi:hypothetical protein